MTRRLVQVPAELTARLPRGSARGAGALSARYRAGTPRAFTAADLVAYAVTRFPATFAAATAALEECAGLEPATVLDVGSGLGATAAAARGLWPAAALTCLEPDGRALAAGRAVLPDADWHHAGLDALPAGRWEMVTAGYVLNELADPLAAARALWERTAGVLVLVEPGRRHSYETLMTVRGALVGAGARVLAPCPHEDPCPLLGRDWCHFGQRLPRSAEHRAAKDADRSYEDEPFSFLALSRAAVPARPSRVLRRPERRRGLVVLDLCTPAGVDRRAVGRSAGADYRRAKDVLWGQGFPAGPVPPGGATPQP